MGFSHQLNLPLMLPFNFSFIGSILTVSLEFLLINQGVRFHGIVYSDNTTSHSLLVVFELSLGEEELLLPQPELFVVSFNIFQLLSSVAWQLELNWLVKHLHLIRCEVFVLKLKEFIKVL